MDKNIPFPYSSLPKALSSPLITFNLSLTLLSTILSISFLTTITAPATPPANIAALMALDTGLLLVWGWNSKRSNLSTGLKLFTLPILLLDNVPNPLPQLNPLPIIPNPHLHEHPHGDHKLVHHVKELNGGGGVKR
mmetsp:Transcript_5591/g.11169  ORF Transcript_5591/g.11169 Transcript_5591/m.11169 type:complete len:136 (-) Transcript_5591:40-447(-)